MTPGSMPRPGRRYCQQVGVATLFTGIAFMLATVIHILRFQANRLKKLADQQQASA